MSGKLYLKDWTKQKFLKKLPLFEKRYGAPSFQTTDTILLNPDHGMLYVDKDSLYFFEPVTPSDKETNNRSNPTSEEIVDETLRYSWLLDRSKCTKRFVSYVPKDHVKISVTTVAYALSPDIRFQIETFTENLTENLTEKKDPTHVLDFYFLLSSPDFIPWPVLYAFFKKMNITL